MDPTAMLLSMLKMRNPQGYEALMRLKSSGKDPNAVLRELMESGQVSESQINQARSQAAFFGIDIPESEVRKAKAVNEKPTPSKFKGLF